MTRAGGSGPLRICSRLADPGALARIRSDGIAWVEDPAEAEALLCAPPGAEGPAHRAGLGLSERETEILEYLADGWSNEEIADRLGISQATVKYHVAGVFRKLGVSRRTEAVREGLRLGVVEI